jgi:hypothetical protein
LAAQCALSQQAAPPKPAPQVQIARVRIATTSASCNGPYCGETTTIEPGQIVKVSRSASNLKKYPDIQKKFKITKEDWEDFQQLFDAKELAIFDGGENCPACPNQPQGWAEVQFSDGTKKWTSFNPVNPASEIAALVKKVQALEAKAEPQGKALPSQ